MAFAIAFLLTLVAMFVWWLGWPGIGLLFMLMCFIDWSGQGDGRQWMNYND